MHDHSIAQSTDPPAQKYACRDSTFDNLAASLEFPSFRPLSDGGSAQNGNSKRDNKVLWEGRRVERVPVVCHVVVSLSLSFSRGLVLLLRKSPFTST